MSKPKPTNAEYIAKARELWVSDDLEIDDAVIPEVSVAEDGAWVSAWVWVSNSDLDPAEDSHPQTDEHLAACMICMMEHDKNLPDDEE